MSDLNNQLAEQNDQLSSLVYPTNSSKATVDIRTIVKYAIVGFVLGTIIEMIWLSIKFIYSNQVYDENDLRNTLDLPILGRFVVKPSFNNLEKRLRKIEDRPLENNASSYEYLKAKDCNKLLVIGDVPEERLNNYCQEIKNIEDIDIDMAGNILNNPRAVSKLVDTEGVIFVAEAGRTSMIDLQNQIKKVREFGKRIVGAIVEE